MPSAKAAACVLHISHKGWFSEGSRLQRAGCAWRSLAALTLRHATGGSSSAGVDIPKNDLLWWKTSAGEERAKGENPF